MLNPPYFVGTFHCFIDFRAHTELRAVCGYLWCHSKHCSDLYPHNSATRQWTKSWKWHNKQDTRLKLGLSHLNWDSWQVYICVRFRTQCSLTVHPCSSQLFSYYNTIHNSCYFSIHLMCTTMQTILAACSWSDCMHVHAGYVLLIIGITVKQRLAPTLDDFHQGASFHCIHHSGTVRV